MYTRGASIEASAVPLGLSMRPERDSLGNGMKRYRSFRALDRASNGAFATRSLLYAKTELRPKPQACCMEMAVSCRMLVGLPSPVVGSSNWRQLRADTDHRLVAIAGASIVQELAAQRCFCCTNSM